MFTWNYSETVPTTANPEQIWDMWRDAETWPSRGSELDWICLDDEFAQSAKGRMKPIGGPGLDLTVDQLSPNRSFPDTACLPLLGTKIKTNPRDAMAGLAHQAMNADKSMLQPSCSRQRRSRK